MSTKPKSGKIIPNLASRYAPKGHKSCPSCGYRCESQHEFLKIANYTTGETFTADICPQCFVKWAVGQFPQLLQEEKEKEPSSEPSLGSGSEG